MDYDLIDYDELEPILDFSVSVIEFFKNDYYVISDFLKGKSPWDNNIMFAFNIDINQLNELKNNMRKAILKVYFDGIVRPAYNQEGDKKIINVVDAPYIEHLSKGRDPLICFLDDDFCFVQILRYYIDIIKYKRDINIHTYNNYNVDVLSMISIYDNLNTQKNIDSKDISNKELRKFYSELWEQTKQYINKCFRDKEKEREFINYLSSLVYANIKKMQVEQNELLEEDNTIISLVEDEVNLLDVFFIDETIAVYVLELIYDNYLQNRLNYDCRKSINDSETQDFLSRLDNNYEDEFEEDLMINDYTLDLRLNYVLAELRKYYNSEELYELLLNSEPIYNFLYNAGLDARNSQYYKKIIIRKIICDVYAYQSYNKSINQDLVSNDYDVLKAMPKDFKSLLEYYMNNGCLLIDTYYKYFDSPEYNKEKIRFYMWKSNQLKDLDQINDFVIVNYFKIILGRIKQLESVDCANRYLAKFLDATQFKKGDNIFINGSEFSTLVKVMSLIVYENLLIVKNLFEDETMKYVKNIIENSTDVVEQALSNPKFLCNLIELFIYFNPRLVTYEQETAKRKHLENNPKSKILKKLNPFPGE